MTEDSIKAISELINLHFLVEDYQRGYKWSNTEVEQLLNDINEFDGDGFYCLQPLVIKNVVENEKNKVELIDGQQRITTIFMILSALENENFKIEYRTRKSSEMFLKHINAYAKNDNWDKLKGTENDNIDNYHFFEAYRIITEWLKDKNVTSFKDKLLLQVKVIWYEVPNTENSKQESIKIFSRINTGKIPLTNAELIKALLLINLENGGNSEALILKQNEVAQQWDTIEYSLQEDAFWYFLSNNKPSATRIDFVFDLITENRKKEFKEYNKSKNLNTFYFYQNSIKINGAEKEWNEVKRVFLTLKEWYEDRQLFHFIGFLIWKKKNLNDIIEINRGKTKSEFIVKIKEESSIKLKQNESLGKIQYPDARIEEILLLFNIISLLKNDTSTNFSFAKYKDGNWDIEHIHARQSEGINNSEDRRTWITETYKELEKIVVSNENEIIRKQLANDFQEILKYEIAKEKFDDLFNKTIEFYNDLDDDKTDMNDLSNLALLDAGTNRSYKNAIFSVKRNKIIDQDERGVFIPICTKNVFLKYYSKDDISQMFLWKNSDRKKYFSAIETTLKESIKIV